MIWIRSIRRCRSRGTCGYRDSEKYRISCRGGCAAERELLFGGRGGGDLSKMKNKRARAATAFVCVVGRGMRSYKGVGERNKKVIINTVNNYSRRERVPGTESIHQPESGGDGRNVFFFVTPYATRSRRRLTRRSGANPSRARKSHPETTTLLVAADFQLLAGGGGIII